ncbi:hypothetical protein [Haliea sp.]|uniref:hypothetical protein n=1 Tax=Haliea sp. TaxID=1932666 RepID=UPI003529574A
MFGFKSKETIRRICADLGQAAVALEALPEPSRSDQLVMLWADNIYQIITSTEAIHGLKVKKNTRFDGFLRYYVSKDRDGLKKMVVQLRQELRRKGRAIDKGSDLYFCFTKDLHYF